MTDQATYKHKNLIAHIHLSKLYMGIVAVICCLYFLPIAVADQKLLTVKVGAYDNHPKIYKTESGEIKGFWPELLNHIAKKENWKIEYVYGTWKQGLDRLKQKKIDMMLDVAFTKDRNAVFAFSQTPVLMSWSRVYTHKENREINNIKDLENKKIGALEQSVNLSGPDGLKELAGSFDITCDFIGYDTYKNVFKALENGDIDAGVTNRNFGNKNAYKYHVKKTAIIFQPINIKFAFPRNHLLTARLSKKIDIHVNELKKNDHSKYYTLIKKHFEGEIAQKKTIALPAWMKFFLTGLVILIIFSLLSVSLLKYQIRKKTKELQLKNSEVIEGAKQYQEIFNATSDAISIHDINTGRICDMNKAMLDMFGYNKKELLLLDVNAFFTQKYAKTKDHFPIVFKTVINKGPQIFEWFAKKKTGESFWVEVGLKYTTIKDKGAIIAVTRDIHERKESQKELAKEKERLAVTLHSIGEAVITTDLKGNIERINRVAEQLTGWSLEDARQKKVVTIFNIILEQTGEKIKNPIEMVLNDGQLLRLASQILLTSKNGTQFPIALSGGLIQDQGKKTFGIVLVFRDITEELRLEKELLKIKKLESLGILAGGIAHDFNNILSVMLGNINLAKRQVESGDKLLRLLGNTEKAIHRAGNLTKQLLTFSKGGAPVRKTTNIKQLIKESADFVLHGSNVACNYGCQNDIGLVDIDQGQISQVIQNLIINACHAMPNGGKIDIQCSNIRNEDKEFAEHFLTAPHIKIVIKDSGTGIPKGIIDKIFDPFFTTKEKGSGLGLATTHSIIKKHKGSITVTSELNKGTVFTIFLPASIHKKLIIAPETALIGIPNGLKVLVMDDDDMMCDVVKDMLSHIGCDSVLVENGDAALKKYSQFLEQGTPFDLSIIDLTIPGGMGGVKTAKKILLMDPKAKIILASGYSNDSVVSKYRNYGFCAAITKPYGVEELLSVIHSIL